MSAAPGARERVAVGAALAVVPAALLVVSRTAETTGLAAFSPMFFPRAVLWCWLGVALLSLGQDVARLRRARHARGAAAPHPASGRAVAGRIALVVAAMGAYVFLVTRLGFLLSSIAFTVATLLALGARSPLALGLYGVLMPGSLFVLFNHVLGLPLPTSPFSHLF